MQCFAIPFNQICKKNDIHYNVNLILPWSEKPSNFGLKYRVQSEEQPQYVLTFPKVQTGPHKHGATKHTCTHGWSLPVNLVPIALGGDGGCQLAAVQVKHWQRHVLYTFVTAYCRKWMEDLNSSWSSKLDNIQLLMEMTCLKLHRLLLGHDDWKWFTAGMNARNSSVREAVKNYDFHTWQARKKEQNSCFKGVIRSVWYLASPK